MALALTRGAVDEEKERVRICGHTTLAASIESFRYIQSGTLGLNGHQERAMYLGVVRDSDRNTTARLPSV